VSARVAFNLREEREVPRVQALLDLSKLATQGLYVAMYVLLGAGILAAFMAGFWGRGWIWTAIVILVARSDGLIKGRGRESGPFFRIYAVGVGSGAKRSTMLSSGSMTCA
jgi:hypothetical protein